MSARSAMVAMVAAWKPSATKQLLRRLEDARALRLRRARRLARLGVAAHPRSFQPPPSAL